MIPEQLRRADRRLLMAGAGLAGVVLGLVLLATVMGGSGGDGGKGGQAASGSPSRPVPVSVAEASAPENSATVELPAVLINRDPFRQLAGVPEALLSEQGAAQNPSTPAPSTNPPVDTSAKASLELKSIVKDGAGVARATVTVDGLSYTPSQGEVFAYGYRLERIEGNCVEVSAEAATANMCVPATQP